jgi:acetyl-CoA carboxylase carboxyltransferase component
MNENKSENPELRILAEKNQQSLEMGGKEKIKKQHNLGRLTARERIQKLLDKNTFFEIGQLAHSDLPEAQTKTPADGKVCGIGDIAGQKVGISADDATVMAGAGGRIGYQKEFKIHQYAHKKGFPSIHLGDGGGARIPDIMGATGMMTFTYDVMSEPRNRKTPLITAIMGECYGGPTWKAANSDIVIQVKGATMAVSGPPVLEAATGEKLSAEELGGWKLHAEKSGIADLFAEDDEDCLRLIRKVLHYLPANYRELPAQTNDFENPQFKQERLLQIIPPDARMAYDMHDILPMIFDKGSLLELKPFFDGSLITAWARLGGQVVGVLANNPKVYAGAMGPGACEKATSFITLCDSFHIPLLFLHDTPGFYVSKTAEERKMPLQIMNFIRALHHSTVPRIALIIRKSYGMAHCNMVGANMGADFMLAWPNAEISFMAPEVALNVMLGKKLKEASSPESLREAFLAEMNRMNAPWEAAGKNLIDKIIDPRDTRKELLQALKIAQGNKNYSRSKRLMANWPKIV